MRKANTRGTIFVFQVSAPKANHGSKITFPSRETLAVDAFIIHLTNNTAVQILGRFTTLQCPKGNSH